MFILFSSIQKYKVKHYLETSEIPHNDRKTNLPAFASTRQLSSLHILELLAFLYRERDAGHLVTVATMKRYLKYTTRVHSFCSIEALPQCDIEDSVIRRTMQTCCHVEWGILNVLGNKWVI